MTATQYTMTIGGAAVNIEAGTLDIEQIVSERSTGSMTVYDATGTQHFTEGMVVAITDNVGANAYTGFVLSSDEHHDTSTALTTHDIHLIDSHYLADKRRAVKNYLNMLAGDILTDLCTSYLAVEGVTGYHSLRTETLQSDWQLINGGGVLDARLDATSSPGDIKLVTSIVQANTDNTQAQFNAGVTSNATVTATPNVITSNIFQNNGSTLTGWTNNGCSVSTSVGNPTNGLQAPYSASTIHEAHINAGMGPNMTMEFDLYVNTSSICGMFFMCNSSGVGQYFRLGAAGTPSVLPTTGWTAWSGGMLLGTNIYPANTWTHCKIVAGATTCTFFMNGVQQGSAYTFANNGGWISINSDGTGTGGYLDNIILYTSLTGTYTSVPLSIGVASGGITASTITGIMTAPTGTSATIQTRYSLNNGTSWSSYAAATSGAAIPGLSGVATDQLQIQYLVTLVAATPSVTAQWVTPNLASMAITVTLGETLGQRVSPSMTLTPTVKVGSSLLTWTATTPANTAVLIETSINAGSSWSTATNGGAIAGLTNGTLLAGVSLLVRQTLATSVGGSTPTLSDLTIRITSSSIQDGPTIVSATWNYETVSSAIDKLAELANFWWIIDQNRRIWFASSGAVMAPFSVSSADMKDGTLDVLNTSPMFLNRQIIRGIHALTGTQVETRKGDGLTRTFTMSYPLAQVPTITLNSIAQTVGIKGVDTGKNWYWAKNDPIIAQDSGGTILLTTDTLSCTYIGEYTGVVQSDDVSSQVTRAVLEGGTSGIVENVIDAPATQSITEAFQYANARLTKYTVNAQTVTFDTMRYGLAPGQLVTVTIPEHNITAQQMLISKVSIKDSTDAYNIYFTVVALLGPTDTTWVKFFDALAKQTNSVDGLSIGASTTLNVLTSTSESWSWSESTTQTAYTCPIIGPSTIIGAGLIVC